MTRPYKVVHVPTNRVHSFASEEAALRRVALLGAIPRPFQGEFVYVDGHGNSYDAPSLIATMETIARVYDISKKYLDDVGVR